MPSPETIVTCAKLAAEGVEEFLPQIAGIAGKQELNMLSLVDSIPGGASLGSLVGKVPALTGEGTIGALEKPLSILEAGGKDAIAPIKTGQIAANFPGAESGIYETNQRLYAISGQALERGATGPVTRPITFDSASDIGRSYLIAKPSAAGIVRLPLPTRLSDGYTIGSGVVVRGDGLVAASRHAVMGAPRGDIWVKLMDAPHLGSMKASVLAEDAANDLVLLKPLRPFVRPIPYLPTGQMMDNVAKGTKILSLGTPNLTADMAGNISGNLTISAGKILDRGAVRYLNNPPANMYWTNSIGDFGMSGAGTFEQGSGRFVGLMNEGQDYLRSALIPADKVKQIVIRNWTR